MSDSQNMSDEVRARLRAIPSVNELLAEWPVVKAAGGDLRRGGACCRDG